MSNIHDPDIIEVYSKRKILTKCPICGLEQLGDNELNYNKFCDNPECDCTFNSYVNKVNIKKEKTTPWQKMIMISYIKSDAKERMNYYLNVIKEFEFCPSPELVISVQKERLVIETIEKIYDILRME